MGTGAATWRIDIAGFVKGKLIFMVMVIHVVMCMVTLPRKWFLVEIVSMVMLIYALVLTGNNINGTGDEGINVPGLGINGNVTCVLMGMALVLLAPCHMD